LSRNAEQYRSKAVALTAAILGKMGTIKVGDTLSNFAFEDIDGELHLLKEIVTDKTLITYIKPDCDGCANPLHLQKLREDYGLGCLMLYDEERLFGSALKIQSFPFNLVVNRDRVILEIHANTLLPDDYKRLFSLFSHPELVEGRLTRSVVDPELVEGRLTRSVVGQASLRPDGMRYRAFSVIPAPFPVMPAEACIQECIT